jgi:hypothetical protein
MLNYLTLSHSKSVGRGCDSAFLNWERNKGQKGNHWPIKAELGVMLLDVVAMQLKNNI